MTTIEFITTVLGGTAFSGVVAALGAWLGKVWATRIAEREKTVLQSEIERLKTELQLVSQIDLDLRAKRIPEYADVWKKLKILPRWPRNKSLTYSDLEELSKQLREWYFDKGGMFLSRETFDQTYKPLQEALSQVLDARPQGLVEDAVYEQIREKCSRFRTALTDDIQSRRRRSIKVSEEEKEFDSRTSTPLQNEARVGI